MINQLAGQSCSIAVDFIVDGDFAVPDTGTVTYTVRDHSGSPVSGQTSVPVTTDGTTTRINVTIPQAVNEITRTIEKRSLIVQYQVVGVPYQIVTHYRLSVWLNHTVTATDVRFYLGVKPHELPDEAIDLVSAYFDVNSEVEDLSEALTGDMAESLAANDAILYRAAIKVIPSLQLAANMSEQVDLNVVSRFDSVDWDRVMRDTTNLYASVIRVLTGEVEIIPPMMVVSQPTDPVTGV